MKNEKEQTITVNTLPDDAELDQIYNKYLYSKLEKSQENIKNGNVITLQDLRNHINELEEMYEPNNIQ